MERAVIQLPRAMEDTLGQVNQTQRVAKEGLQKEVDLVMA